MLYKFMQNGQEIVLNQKEYDTMRILKNLEIDYDGFRTWAENEYAREELKRWIKRIATVNKVDAIKFVRVLSGWGLKEAIDFVEAL